MQIFRIRIENGQPPLILLMQLFLDCCICCADFIVLINLIII